MSDFPGYEMPVGPILTPFSPEAQGSAANSVSAIGTIGAATSSTWPTNNIALYYPFRLTSWATAYQLLFWVGATSSGNIDVGIYDSQYNRIVSAGTTAMSATVNTVQEINITDTVLSPGDYLLGGACSTTAGTVFRLLANDEIGLSGGVAYEQASAMPLPDPAVPVISTNANPVFAVIGIQFRSVF